LIDKLVKGFVESAEKDSDKLATPFSAISFHLQLNNLGNR
jgi:hypothetical protein